MFFIALIKSINLRKGNETFTIWMNNQPWNSTVLPGAAEHYLDMLKYIQKQVHCATGPLDLTKIILMWSV